MKKYSLLILLPSLILGVCSVGCGSSRKVDKRFTLANLGNDVNFHTDFQQGYLDEEDVEKVPEEAKGLTEYSIPNSVKLSWECQEELSEYVVGIGEKKDLSDQKEYTVSGATELELYNLKIATKYYWTVKEKDSEIMSKTATFTIRDQGPRNLNIPGMTNCRDIGGYKTNNGGRVKQDLIWRTGSSDKITAAGKEVIKSFGMKTEIDLRDQGYKSKSPVSDDIEYKVYKMYYNDYSNYLERNCESVKSTMKIFANEDYYPIFYHCRIGTDRTGYVTYLLLGLLGVDIQDIYRDYLFSNFGVIEDPRSLHGSGVNNVQLYYDAIDDFPGETLQEHIYNFLIGIGMTAEELDNIIRINVEGGKEVKLLKDRRPLSIQANKFAHSDGISMSTYKNSASLSTIEFYPLNGKKDENITVSFKNSKQLEADIYCYMYAATASLNIKACDAFALDFDSSKLDVTERTFSDLHCRNTAGIYVCARLAKTTIGAGEHTLKLTNIASESNSSALGANVAAIVIIPRTAGDLNAI